MNIEMKVRCGRCGFITEARLTGPGARTIHQPPGLVHRCPVLAERLEALGVLNGEDLFCPDLQRAEPVGR